MSLTIARHAVERAHKRLPRVLNGTALEDAASAALTHGIGWEAATGRLRRYLLKLVCWNGINNGRSGRRLIVHEGAVYVFADDNALVTCWRLPKDVTRAA